MDSIFKGLSHLVGEDRVIFQRNSGDEHPTVWADPSKSDGQKTRPTTSPDARLGLAERALSASGAAFVSAILVNPLDVVKTRLQTQAAGSPYSHPLGDVMGRTAYSGPATIFADLRCSPSCTRAGTQGTVVICPPDCFHYKGTIDVFHKIIRQEGFARLWRGTNAALALAVPMVGIYLPCYDVFRNRLEEASPSAIRPYAPLLAGAMARSLACAACYPMELARTRMQAFKAGPGKPPGVWGTLAGVRAGPAERARGYRFLWVGLGAQLARDVPFSAVCWSTLEPVRRRLLGDGDGVGIGAVVGANFLAGLAAGGLAAGVTCPLDVAKTRRQIERDPGRAVGMTTWGTLVEIWRGGGARGLFAGVGPRVARAGPSVAIVVSFYEVVKHVLNR